MNLCAFTVDHCNFVVAMNNQSRTEPISVQREIGHGQFASSNSFSDEGSVSGNASQHFSVPSSPADGLPIVARRHLLETPCPLNSVAGDNFWTLPQISPMNLQEAVGFLTFSQSPSSLHVCRRKPIYKNGNP